MNRGQGASLRARRVVIPRRRAGACAPYHQCVSLPMSGFFISFEGTEGCGKSTQMTLLAEHLRSVGHVVRSLREPGGTPIGEEIRHTLKHSAVNHAMTPEAELLLLNASRAQLVREV